jgi:iron-sulfur cluster assembly protein
MAITLTPAAVDRVRQFMAKEPSALGLRFGVRKSGCSGWAYVVDIATAASDDDVVFEQDGVSVRVDAESLAAVDGGGTEGDGHGSHYTSQRRNAPNG